MSISFWNARFIAFYLWETENLPLPSSSSLRLVAGTRFRTKSRKSSAAELSVAEPLPGFTSGMHEMERGFATRRDTHLQRNRLRNQACRKLNFSVESYIYYSCASIVENNIAVLKYSIRLICDSIISKDWGITLYLYLCNFLSYIDKFCIIIFIIHNFYKYNRCSMIMFVKIWIKYTFNLKKDNFNFYVYLLVLCMISNYFLMAALFLNT